MYTWENWVLIFTRQEIEEQIAGDWSRIISPKPEGLSDAARIISAALERKRTADVYANNQYEGSAPLTLERLVERMGGEGGMR